MSACYNDLPEGTSSQPIHTQKDRASGRWTCLAWLESKVVRVVPLVSRRSASFANRMDTIPMSLLLKLAATTPPDRPSGCGGHFAAGTEAGPQPTGSVVGRTQGGWVTHHSTDPVDRLKKSESLPQKLGAAG